jgi:autotransporter-associated beta strand protein
VGILLAVAMALMATPARALVEHPNTIAYPNSEEPPLISDRPPDAVVGWWSDNASAVAIGPNYIVTTCHQLRGVGATVNFGGTDYTVAEVFQHAKADLRICRITTTGGADANLTSYVGYNTSQAEANQTAVMGGFGFGRGTAYPTYYDWAWTDNKTERWGQNYVEYASSASDPASFSSQLLVARFDNYGTANWVPYEACVAKGDSGGGWFLKNPGGQWVVAGLSRGVTHAAVGQAWFLASGGDSPDLMDGIRLSSYTAWLDNALSRSTWNSTSGGTYTWSDGTKWSGGVPNAADKFAVFSDTASGSRTVTLGSNATVGTLRFDCLGDVTIDATGSYRLEFYVSYGTAAYTWDTGLLEMANTKGNGSLTIAAPVQMTAPLLVRQNSGGTLTISGVISDSTSRALIKTGTGMLVLSGANTYKGGTTINQGTLRVTNAAGLGNTNTSYVTVAGATLDVQSDSALTLNNKVKVIANPTSGVATSNLNVDRATPGPARTMTFSGSLTADGAVTLNVTSATGCSAAFSGAASFTNLGSGTATINTASADLALTGGVSMTSGTLVKTGPNMLTLSNGSGTQAYGAGATLRVNQGALALNADAGGSTAACNLAVEANNSSAVAFGVTQHLASLSLGGTSNASVAAGGTKTLLVKSLDIAGGASPTARLDMADNNLIVDFSGSGAGPLTQVRDWVKAGANFDPKSGELLWNGNGIMSSTAAAGDHMLVGLGVRNAVDVGTFVMPTMTALDGVAVDSTATLVKFTYLGDVNLDGIVDQNDYDVMDYYQLMGTPPETDPFGSGWWTGDMDGNGVVDQNDYDKADYGQLMRGAPLGTAGPGLAGLSVLPQDTGLGAAIGGASVVPEPGTLLLLWAGALGLLRKRR